MPQICGMQLNMMWTWLQVWQNSIHGQPRSETSIANQFYLILMVYINVDIYIYVLYIHTCMHACMHAYIHFITLHYITLHYITLHYITYIHMYIFTTHGEFLDP